MAVVPVLKLGHELRAGVDTTEDLLLVRARPPAPRRKGTTTT
jgi:hypothetical protein